MHQRVPQCAAGDVRRRTAPPRAVEEQVQTERRPTSSMRARCSLPPQAGEAGEEPQVLADREHRVHAGLLRCEPDQSLHGGRPSTTTSIPPTCTCPASGRRSPAMIETSDVFPAPFGPRRPRIVPAETVRSTPVERNGRAVGLAEPHDLQHRIDRRAPPVRPGTVGLLRCRCVASIPCSISRNRSGLTRSALGLRTAHPRATARDDTPAPARGGGDRLRREGLPRRDARRGRGGGRFHEGRRLLQLHEQGRLVPRVAR